MRAFQLTDPGKAEVREVGDPDPRPGEVLVRVTGAGVCHSDLHILHATEALFPTPMTFGHEVAGAVQAVGDGVLGWDDGTPVLVYLAWGCGRCRHCAVGAENYCETYPRAPLAARGSERTAGWPSSSLCRIATSFRLEISTRSKSLRSRTPR